MDMKSMIARMDAIESKKILKEDAAPTGFDGQVDEFVGGTAAAKVAAWLAHIKKLRAQGFSQAAADAEKSLAQVHPDYRMIAKQQQTAPMPEFRGSIAKALMQDMGVEEDGETQPPNIPREPLRSSDGQIVRSSDGQPVMSGGQERQGIAANPGEYVPPTTIGADDADAGGGEDPENYGYSGSDAPVASSYPVRNPDIQPANPGTDLANWQEPGGSDSGAAANPPSAAEVPGSTNDQGAGQGEEDPGTIDPNDVKRFGELLDKLEKGAGGAAANPPAGQQANPPAAQGYKGSAGAQAIHKLNPQIKDINKIFPGQQLKMPNGSTYTVKPGDTMDKIARGMRSGASANPPPSATFSPQVMQGTMPATVREDDITLDRIRAFKI